MEGTDVFEEKLAGLLEEAKKKKNVLEYQEVMNYFGQEPPVSNQLDRLFEFLDQNKVDVIRMGTEDELDPDLLMWNTWTCRFPKASAWRTLCACI